MKDNTGPAMDLLHKALRQVPTDFTLREVRYHISQAIHKLEHVDSKRKQRASQERKAVPATPNLPFYPAEALGIIDRMLETESKKLEEFKAKKEKVYVNNIESGTILG